MKLKRNPDNHVILNKQNAKRRVRELQICGLVADVRSDRRLRFGEDRQFKCSATLRRLNSVYCRSTDLPDSNCPTRAPRP